MDISANDGINKKKYRWKSVESAASFISFHWISQIFADKSSFDTYILSSNTTHFETPAFRKDHLKDDQIIGMSVKEGFMKRINSQTKVKGISFTNVFGFQFTKVGGPTERLTKKV